MTSREYKRGDIIYVDFGNNEGSVQSGKRPAMIIGNDKGNYFSPVLIVAPITSQPKKDIPTHLKINKGIDSGLSSDSIVLIEQPMTIDKKQAGNIIGYHNIDKFTEIKILITFGCLTFLGEKFRRFVCL
ncbi:MAG: type II toxin-antitoxin system PemK/MazF family toxin [Oscillospiraceae bacterium]